MEGKYAKELTVVGIHSAKFTNEGATENIRKAAQRYGLTHPIANDSAFTIWNHYSVESWPTLALIDPDGKFVGQVSGEGNYEVLDAYIAAMVKVFDEKKKIDRDKIVGKPEPGPNSVLKFPAKIIAQAEPKRLFIADTNNNRILVSGLDGVVTDVIGSGNSAQKDGDFKTAAFHMPHGMAVSGDTLYIADCENQALRKIDLKAKTVETIAGTGQQVRARNGGAALSTPLDSPWDLALSADGKLLYVAMAGDHRIWVMDLAAQSISVLAGTGKEDIVDGPFAASAFAQPSGLALNGDTLYIADSEASAIRALDLKAKTSRTIIGFPNIERGRLFAFGDVDGILGTAKLQHALGMVCVNDRLYITDTYNHKLKVVDPVKKSVATFLGDGKPGPGDEKTPRFYEPGGLTYLDGNLYVADTDDHRICVVDIKTKAMKILDLKLPK